MPVANPMGTDGFEFIECTAPDSPFLNVLFERLGFEVAARHRSKAVTLYAPRKQTDEVAVMLDARDALDVGHAAEGVEWREYADSWK